VTVRSDLTPRVAALAASLNIPVAYENNGFKKPPNNAPFLEMLIIPSVLLDVTTDGTRQRDMGYMQINVYTQQDVGTKQGEDIARAVQAAFPIVPKTTATSIEATPSIRQAIIDEGGYRVIPIIIPYRLELET